MMKKWDDRKDLIFSHVCMVRRVKKQKDEKLFCLIGKKKRRMKNVVYINRLLYHYYIMYKKYIYLYSLNNIKINTNLYIFILLFFIIIYNFKFMYNKN